MGPTIDMHRSLGYCRAGAFYVNSEGQRNALQTLSHVSDTCAAIPVKPWDLLYRRKLQTSVNCSQDDVALARSQ